MPKISLRFRLLILAFVVIVMAVLYHFLVAGRQNAQVYVVLRYDDYANGSSKMVEKAIIDNLNNYNFSCSFGVIPFMPDSAGNNPVPLDSDKIKMISKEVKEGKIEICQHGFDHISYSNKSPYSEFMGRPYESQFELISAGKELLERSFNTRVSTFIPPWNTYDENTVRILSSLGVDKISADQLQIADNSKFSYIPFTAMLSDVNKLASLKRIPSGSGKNVIVLLLHDYDFTEVVPETGITSLTEFDATFKMLAEKNWKVISVSEAVKLGIFENRHYKLNRMKMNLLSHLKPVITPGILFNKLNSYHFIYLSVNQVILLFFLVVLYYYIIFLVLNELMFFSILVITKRFTTIPNIRYVIWGGGTVLIIALSFFFWRDDHTFGTSEILVLVALASFMFSTILNAYPKQSIGFKFKPDLVEKRQ